MAKHRDPKLMAEIMVGKAAGLSTDEIAKKTGKNPETIRRYTRSDAYKAFEGRWMVYVDDLILACYKSLMKEIPNNPKIARDVFNAIVPKTIGGNVKSEAVVEEKTRGDLEEFRKLTGKTEKEPEEGSI